MATIRVMRSLLLVLFLLGCEGSILSSNLGGLTDPTRPQLGPRNPNGPPGSPSDPQTPVGQPGVDARIARCQSEFAMAWGALRRVTHEEYDNSVGRLLSTKAKLATTTFPAQAKSNGYTTGSAQQAVGELLGEAYFEAAETLAAEAVKNVPALLQCDVASVGQAECGRRFVSRFLTQAFRRAPEAAELTAYQQLLSDTTTQFAFSDGLEVVVLAVLQSPHFLYHVDRGPEVVPGIRKLSGATIAARLATVLWQSLPDDDLLAAASRGELDEAAGVAAQARRMLDDAKARPVLIRMFSEMTRSDELQRVSKDTMRYANWDTLKKLMQEENARFIESIVFESPGTVESLFTAKHTFVDSTLAQHYGLPAVSGWQRTSLDATKRMGLLTQGSVLSVNAKTNQSSPTLRGLFIRENVLCNPPPPPPQNAAIVPPDIRPGVSTRERFAEHSKNPECAGCHLLMDPIGLGFENYDAVGSWRNTDEGVPVDASGKVFGTSAEGDFVGVDQLALKLATSKDVNTCMSKQVFRYLLARHEFDADTCSLYQIERGFEGKPVSLKELVIALTTTDAFRHRKIDP